MLGVYREGDEITGCWSAESLTGDDVGCTVGYDGVTKILIGKADGPMGFYAVAQVFRGDELWQILPLHMMQSVEIAPRGTPKESSDG